MNEMDWYRVIDKLYNLSYTHSGVAGTALKEGNVDISVSHMTVAIILTSLADALKEGLRYKGS
jgi:hypothetical protein